MNYNRIHNITRYSLALFLGLFFLFSSVSANPVGHSDPSSGHFLFALITTWLIEIPILVLLIRLFKLHAVQLNQIILTGIACTIITLPILWFVLPAFIFPPSYPLVGEIIVILIEAAIIRFIIETNNKTAVVCSLLMNTASFIIGLLLRI